MATQSVNDILARSRIIATQMAGDGNYSSLIDSRPGLRALLNNAIDGVYKKRAQDQKSWRDIAVRSTIAMTSNTGTLPSGVLREYLHQADFANDAGDLISYVHYDMDNQQLFRQLVYVTVQGDSINYTPARS